MGLVDLAFVKQHAGISVSDTAHDDLLTEIIEGVSSLFASVVGEPLELTTTERWLDARCSARLVLPFGPINAIDTIEEDGVALTEDDDFRWAGWIVTRVSGDAPLKWSSGDENLHVIWTHGYEWDVNDPDYEAPVQGAVRLAAAEEVRRRFELTQGRGDLLGVARKASQSGTTTDFLTDDLLPATRLALSRFRRRPAV